MSHRRVRRTGNDDARGTLTRAAGGGRQPGEPGAGGAVESTPGTGWRRRLGHGLKDTGRRTIYTSALAIPGHLVMAGMKALVLLETFSAFLAANVLFTLGMAVIKTVVVLADRRSRHGDATAASGAYRATGVLIVVLSALYIVSCLPLALGANTSESYEKYTAIGIATIAFVELGFSVRGFFSSRRRGDPLMEAVKLSSLASSLVLLVLTQTALLSFASTEDSSPYNGWCGVGMGVITAGIGMYMTLRRKVGP